MKHALKNLPFNLQGWIDDNKETLKPPIGNRQLYKGDWENLLVMMVGGPNFRHDYHDDPGEELFIQLRGDLVLKLFDPITRAANPRGSNAFAPIPINVNATTIATHSFDLKRKIIMPAIELPMASRIASTASSLLLSGSLNASLVLWPAHAKKTTNKPMCTIAPATLSRATAATAVGASTPDFWRYRALSAMPPTLAGVIRLTNDDATWVAVVGKNGSGTGTAPVVDAAEPT